MPGIIIDNFANNFGKKNSRRGLPRNDKREREVSAPTKWLAGVATTRMQQQQELLLRLSRG